MAFVKKEGKVFGQDEIIGYEVMLMMLLVNMRGEMESVSTDGG